MKKFLLLIFAFSVLHGGEFSISFNNLNNEKLSGFPIVFPAENADDGSFNAIEIKDGAGKIQPSQWDDLNGNGKVDPEDEITFIPTLLPGKNVFSCRWIKTASAVHSTAVDKSGVLSIKNDLVKVSQHTTKLQQRTFFYKNIPVAGAFILEPRMDNSWKWKNSAITVKKITSGPLRQTLRVEMVKTGTENGKTVKIINDLSIFSGRQEVLSTLRFVNTSPSQLVQINTVNTGMYQVLSDGRNPIADLNFSATAKSRGTEEKIMSGKLRTSSFLLNRPHLRQVIWGDTVSANGAFGMTATDNVQNFLIRSIAGGKSIRMSFLFSFEKAVLWPGRSLSLTWYMIPHHPEDKSVQQFARTIKNVNEVMQ